MSSQVCVIIWATPFHPQLELYSKFYFSSKKDSIEYVMRLHIHVRINDAKRGKGESEKKWMYQHISNRYSNAHKKKKKLLPRSTKAINVIMIIMIVISCFRYKLQTGHNTSSILSHWLSFLPTLLTLLFFFHLRTQTSRACLSCRLFLFSSLYFRWEFLFRFSGNSKKTPQPNFCRKRELCIYLCTYVW